MRKCRTVLISFAVKESRRRKVRREFAAKAEKISTQIEKHLDILREQLLPPLEPILSKTKQGEATTDETLLSEILGAGGINERSLRDFFIALKDTPTLSMDFFERFTDNETIKHELVTEKSIIID